MTTGKEFELRKAVSPYVCSSPQDFEAERQFLSQVIFPKVNNFCSQRGAHFSPFDILWSEKDNYFKNGQLLHFLLDFAKKCSPYLICLLGDRYGPYRPENAAPLPRNITSIPNEPLADPLDENFRVAAMTGHSWILEPSHQTASILELEIIQAAFLGETEHCTFYFRQSEHLAEKLNVVESSEHERCKCDYLPENEHAELKVKDLKQRIINKGLPVKYFKNINELGDLVLKDWKTIIDMIYPPLYNDGDFLETEEYREWVYQQCYGLNCLENYVGSDMAEDIMNQLTDFALTTEIVASADVDSNKLSRFQLSALSNYLLKRNQTVAQYDSLLVMSGDKGIGKTSLIAKWLQEFRQAHPEMMIISHFVGCSQNSTDIAVILRRCVADIKKTLKEKSKHESFAELDQTKTFQELSEAFLAAVSSLPCLLVIDGLDELSGSLGQTPQEVKDFNWLPFPLPPQCKLIMTTSRSDLTCHSLSKRADVKIIHVKKLFESQQKQLILMENMKHNYEKLSKHNLKQVLDIKLTDKPLFLRLLASEMSCFNVFTDLSEYLDDHYELCSVREFWIKSYKRWVDVYNWRLEAVFDGDSCTEEERETMGWVPDVLRLIVLSRNGLTQREILSLLYQLGYKGRRTVSMLDWLALRECLGSSLCEINGFLKFSHQHLIEVAEYKLFRSVKQAASEIRPTEDTNQKRILHQHLAMYFIEQPFSHRQLEELPWQLMMAGNFDSLVQILTHDRYLLSLLDEYMKNPSDRLNLMYYWKVLVKGGYSPVYIYTQYLASLGLTTLDIDHQSNTNNISFDEDNADIKEINTYISNKIKTSLGDRELSVIEENENEEIKSQTGKTLSSCSGRITNDSYVADDEAEDDNNDDDEDESKVSRTQTKLTLCQLVSLSWHISQLLLELGYQNTTLKILVALADYLHKNYPFGLFEQLIYTRSLECVGNLYLVNGDNTESYIYYKKALRAVLELSDGDDERLYESEIQMLKGNMLNQLGKMKMKEGNFYEADGLFKEALDCFQDFHGDKSMAANIEYNLGILRLEEGDYINGETCLQESLAIRERQGGKSNILVADNLIALARLFSMPLNIKGYDRIRAESYYRRALSIREKCLGSEGLLVAEVLFELGRLIGEDPSYLAKVEAVSLLSRSLDIKTKYLGGDHVETKTIQNVLTSIEVAIKLGKYQFGSAKPVDKRSREFPYSNLSFREKDLNKVQTLEKDRQNQLSLTRSYSCDSLYCDPSRASVYSYMSASEKILLENDRPSLVKRDINTQGKSRPSQTMYSNYMTPVTGLQTLARREINADMRLQDMKVKQKKDSPPPIILEEVIDNYASDVYSNPPSSPQLSPTSSSHAPVSKIKIMKLKGRPNSAPLSIFQRYNSSNDKRLLNSRTGFKNNRRVSSALNPATTSCHRPNSGISSHSSYCHIPGPQSIQLSETQTVLGPHSSLKSLLGPPPAPREVTKRVHHKSAWYHIPGRYSTSREGLSKRPQERPGSAFCIGYKNQDQIYTIDNLRNHQKSNSMHEMFYDVNEYGEIVPLPHTVSFTDALNIGKMNICR